MSKRARYVGPHAGVDVHFGEPGDVSDTRHVVHVQHNHLLPEESPLGDKIPASRRDELLESDDWVEFDQADSSKESKKEGDK